MLVGVSSVVFIQLVVRLFDAGGCFVTFNDIIGLCFLQQPLWQHLLCHFQEKHVLVEGMCWRHLIGFFLQSSISSLAKEWVFDGRVLTRRDGSVATVSEVIWFPTPARSLYCQVSHIWASAATPIDFEAWRTPTDFQRYVFQ